MYSQALHYSLEVPNRVTQYYLIKHQYPMNPTAPNTIDHQASIQDCTCLTK